MLVAVVAFVATVALAATFFSVPSADAQTETVPEDLPDNSRNWDPKIPFAPGEEGVAENPAAPTKCGQDIAFVFDLSSSIGADGLENSKKAGNEIVNALNDTPTRIGIYNFGTTAPAAGNENATIEIQEPGSADDLTQAIENMNLRGAATNWDRGIGQIPEGTYDVVYFITDGLPTVFGNAEGSGDSERGLYNRPGYYHDNGRGNANKDYAAAKADVQRAVTSANTLKKSGTRIVPLAVGDAVNQGTVAPTYLNYISGEGDWIPVSNYNELAEKLVEQATTGCRGEVSITKKLETKGSSAEQSEDTSVDGWKFSITVTEADGEAEITSLDEEVTTEGGTATLRYLTSGRDTAGTVTIEEIDGNIKDVKCTDEDGKKVEVSRKDNSFTVPAKTGGKVSCEVTNLVGGTPDQPSGSSVPDRCLPAVGGLLGITLLALPIALLSHVKAPALQGLQAQISEQIKQTNTQIQRGLGIHDERTSAFAAQVDDQLKALAYDSQDVLKVLGGLAALAASAGVLLAYCVPGIGSSGQQTAIDDALSSSGESSENDSDSEEEQEETPDEE
ncbi:VWA domain-containing protein [Corynebacterium appendicis]|uniref:vWA domain-containing protein n=1 Tax=Corynebacterium appendicis TaxID=163202 RepID=UPI00223C3DD6|nr:vWA domain-containing protein [Corynebacterium appendicis]MCT1683978.1 VWA domain-containing protein [Corynebacterium appendicis]